MRIRVLLGLLACLLFAGLYTGAPEAWAYRAPLAQEGGSEEDEEAWLAPAQLGHLPKGSIEGACGVAVAPSSGTTYVADYYHRTIGFFSSTGLFLGFEKVFDEEEPLAPIHEGNAVCGLAVDASGNRYGNELHGAVLTLPGKKVVDPGPATGIAVDKAGNLYVDDRTYVAVYDAPLTPGEPAAEKIGLNHLGDAYGVAVNPEASRVYVADAASDTVKVFEPAIDLELPAEEISGSPEAQFSSLKDAAVAVDAGTGEGQGHVLVADNLDPGGEKPRSAIYEFDATGNYLDVLQSGRPYSETQEGPLFGEPSGLAVDPKTGDLYVTTGNSVASNLLKYGPFQAFAPPQALEAQSQPPTAAAATSASTPGAASAATGGAARQARATASTVVQRGPVRVNFDGKLTPHALPRHGVAPVGITVDARISATRGGTPPQLRRIAIQINRNGRFSTKGLPICVKRDIQPSTTAGARAACGESLVGEGHFSANVKLPKQSPFPSSGKVLAFNGRLHGRPAILAHIYGTEPVPTSIVLPFTIRETHGTYGTVLETSLPRATGNWGYVTGLEMKLHRSFRYRGKRRSYLSAGCPAPAGFPGAAFPLARTSFAFAGGMTLISILNRDCKAKG
jgi:DNA-binding beta-propeller fold protein YncE